MGKEKLKKQTNFNAQKLKNNKAITLIALVVTIVVLLILAGISISLVIGDNGLIQKSKDAKLETRAGTVEDETEMWKHNNYINISTGKSIEDSEEFLQSLIDRKLITEDEIDRSNETITIKRKDESVVKQISYSNVNINISKTPEIEKSGVVILNITSVEGMTIPNIKTEEELNNFMTSLNEKQKKEIIKKGFIKGVNAEEPSANCTTFQDVLEWYKKEGELSEATEDAFWTKLLTQKGIDEVTMQMLGLLVCYNKITNTIVGYTVIEPVDAIFGEYKATENGTYTFKVQDIITGKTYTKKVEVTNIDTSLPPLMISTDSLTARTNDTQITLQNVKENKNETFEKAYIVYNNEKIDITSLITQKTGDNSQEYSSIGTLNIGEYLARKLKVIPDERDISRTNQTIILEKDGREYKNVVNMGDIEYV